MKTPFRICGVPASERDIDREGEELLVVAVEIDEGESEVEGERGLAEGGDVQAQTRADGDAVVVEGELFVQAAGVGEDDDGDDVLEDGLLEFGAEEEVEVAADVLVAEFAGVVADAKGADAAVAEAAEVASAGEEAFEDGGVTLGGEVAGAGLHAEDGLAAEVVLIDGQEQGVFEGVAGEVEVAGDEADLLDADLGAGALGGAGAVVDAGADELEADAGEEVVAFDIKNIDG